MPFDREVGWGLDPARSRVIDAQSRSANATEPRPVMAAKSDVCAQRDATPIRTTPYHQKLKLTRAYQTDVSYAVRIKISAAVISCETHNKLVIIDALN